MKCTRDRRKLHARVDGRGFIIAHGLTESRVDVASVEPGLPSQVSEEVERLTADGVYDKMDVYGIALRNGR